MNEKLTVMYEDNHIIVVLKPQNVPSQGDSSGDKSVLDMVKDYLVRTHDKKGEAFAGLVHRLDRPTGGVMVFAKTSKAASRLAEQIRSGMVEKNYLAVVYGLPRDRRARLTDYLVKDESENIVRVVPAAIEGAKLATLDYTVLDTDGKLSLLKVDLLTGRSHQARVQLKNIGCPIYNDSKYAPGRVTKPGYLALWAYRLRFEHPTTKKTMVFVAYPPEDRDPWQAFPVEKYVGVVAPK